MGNRNIKKEVKKMKKSDKKALATVVSSVPKPITVQPVLIKKERKTK
ncbi:MAG: hypothetical protein RSA86_07135 [Christensenellaceae bacterium]